MTGFWIIVGALSVGVALLLVLVLFRQRARGLDAADYDISVYRDQLAEITRDLERGVISPDVAERTRIEVSRRILDADKARQEHEARAPRAVSIGAAGLVVLLLVAGSFGLYGWLGAPGYGDLPLKTRLEASKTLREERPGQAEAETQAAARMPPLPPQNPEYVALVEKLRAAVAETPDDLRGQTLLAQNEAALGNFANARDAQGKVLELLGSQAQGSDWADFADMQILAAGGYVSPEAETALVKALELDPQNGPARYYTGLMHAQTGRPDLAFGIWRNLLESSPPDAPWVVPIRHQIEDVALRAGVRFALPSPEGAAPRGPTREDMEAAAEMTDDERMDMIRGMVAGLSDRLATEGGPPQDWARLIGALGVLGETEQARAIWTESQTVFADSPEALSMLAQAAAQAGLAE